MSAPFLGCKLAILVGEQIVTILRDDIPTIPWPGYWDLPGGGREGAESPEACVLRELEEELGLVWAPTTLQWSAQSHNSRGTVWFFVTEAPEFDVAEVTFGNEGQEWRLQQLDWYLTEAKAVPHHLGPLRKYLTTRPR
ncbi:MAG: NUDIX domain-containing protein [Pseudomonadota bacterium]